MTESGAPRVRQGFTSNRDAVNAAREIHAAIYQPDAVFNVFYCAPTYDRAALAKELRTLFGGQTLIGCTTAGEIGPRGYSSGAISGASLAARGTQVLYRKLSNLESFQICDGQVLAQRMLDEIDPDKTARAEGDVFGFLLIDGMSCREEQVVAALYRGLRDVQLFGGSAADGANFGPTYVYCDGEFSSDCAIFTLVKTTLPFVVFKTEHFQGTDIKLVVTGADPEHRTVTEINGLPAAQGYAQAIGIATSELSPTVFATHPVVVRLGGQNYVRSIQKMNADQSLTFYCAIDEGIVLTLARGSDIVANLQTAFAHVREQIGPPQLVLGCDCILRGLELDQRELRGVVGDVMASNNVCGFGTYGEQFNAVHANQTFTAVAIGSPVSAAK